MTSPEGERSDRAGWAVAVAAASVTFVASYAVQRLWAAWGDTGVAPAMSAWIPYRWRCGLALLQALAVASVVGPLLSEGAATVVLRWAPLWVPLIVVAAALAMLAVP